jgi:hypothetical protein
MDGSVGVGLAAGKTCSVGGTTGAGVGMTRWQALSSAASRMVVESRVLSGRFGRSMADTFIEQLSADAYNWQLN